MALHPAPGDRVRGYRRIEALPEVNVLHRLLVGRAPAILLPAAHPCLDAALEILAVGVERDGHRPR